LPVTWDALAEFVAPDQRPSNGAIVLLFALKRWQSQEASNSIDIIDVKRALSMHKHTVKSSMRTQVTLNSIRIISATRLLREHLRRFTCTRLARRFGNDWRRAMNGHGCRVASHLARRPSN